MFISVSNNLPKTSYIKMVDIWLIFNLLIPFFEVSGWWIWWIISMWVWVGVMVFGWLGRVLPHSIIHTHCSNTCSVDYSLPQSLTHQEHTRPWVEGLTELSVCGCR